jgi:hypothetical protein
VGRERRDLAVGYWKGVTSCEQVELAGALPVSRYVLWIAVAHAERNRDVCPQPSTVRSREFGNSPWAVRAP